MSKRKRQRSSPSLKWPDLPVAELSGIVERARTALNETEYAKLKAAMETLTFLTQELQAKGTTIDRLRRMLFGASTEKTSQVVGEPSDQAETVGDPKPRRPGHGRNAAAAYTGAERVKVPHAALQGGDCCPECAKGKVYPLAQPSTLVRITGMAPLGATVYECDRLRCNLCGEVFTASTPEGVGEKKYDETATGMVGLLKYGTGLPFNRIEKLQQGLGIPLPATTQWELVSEGAASLKHVHEELIRQAAQGEVLFNDDTTMKVLELTGEQRAAAAADEETDGRTGVFTSGIVATKEDHHIALFFTGVQHAGENLTDVLAKRAAELPKPIQMCDASASNTAGEFESIVAGWHLARTEAIRGRGGGLPGGVSLRTRDAARRLQARRHRPAAADVPPGAPALPPDRERPPHGQPRGVDEGSIRRAQSRTELRAGRGHPLHAEALVEADALPARARRPIGQ